MMRRQIFGDVAEMGSDLELELEMAEADADERSSEYEAAEYEAEKWLNEQMKRRKDMKLKRY